MLKHKIIYISITVLMGVNAYAIPSFARQTGLSCAACHSVFPELTQTGRQFKLNGYVMGGGKHKMPLSAAILVGMTSIGKSTYKTGAPVVVNSANQNKNNTYTIPQISIYYGGQIYSKIGAFIQLAYDGTLLPKNRSVITQISNSMTDIRYANSFVIGHNTLHYGIALDNNPNLVDIYASSPGWSFPWASSAVAPSPAASILIDGNLGGQVVGLTAYGLYDYLLYFEIGGYQSSYRQDILKSFGWAHDRSGSPRVHGTAPYARIALQQYFGNSFAMIGAYGMTTQFSQDGTNSLDTYRDWAIDSEYQYIHGKNIITATATGMWENTSLNGSKQLGLVSNTNDMLTTIKAKVGYYYEHTYGASLGYQDTYGTADAKRYGTYGNLTPNSSLEIAQLNYLPLENIKFTIQYTMYNKFNGATNNYNGHGRNAADNNTLYLLGWFMF